MTNVKTGDLLYNKGYDYIGVVIGVGPTTDFYAVEVIYPIESDSRTRIIKYTINSVNGMKKDFEAILEQR